MKSNKGIALMSLIIYVIILSVVVGIVASLTRYFYKGNEEIVITSNVSEQYIRLIKYITQDINSRKNNF